MSGGTLFLKDAGMSGGWLLPQIPLTCSIGGGKGGGLAGKGDNPQVITRSLYCQIVHADAFIIQFRFGPYPAP